MYINIYTYWTRLFSFHIELIPLEMVYIHIFFQLWINSRADYSLLPFCMVTTQGEGKLY